MSDMNLIGLDVKTLSLPNRQIKQKYWAALLVIIVLSGMAFRIYFIDYRSFWIDEAFSTYYASSGIKNLFNLLQSKEQAPLYFLLLHFWIKLLGDSDFTVRLFSIIWGCIGILGIYYLLKYGLKWSKRSVLVAVFLVVINPLHVYYSIEARPYSMLFALTTFYLAVLILMYSTGEKRYCIAFASLQTLMLYTHPTSAIYCLTVNAIYLLLLLSMKQLNRIRFRNLLIANAITVLLFLPWVKTYWLQVQTTYSHFWAPPLTLVDAIRIWGRLILFLSTDLIDLHTKWFEFSTSNVLIWAAIVSPVAILMFKGAFYSLKRPVLPEALIVTSFFLYPLILYIISILYQPIMITRILIPAFAGFPILILLPIKKHMAVHREKLTAILLAVFVLICLALNFLIINVGGAEDWRRAAAAISKISKKNELILIYENYNTLLFNRYNKSDLVVKGIPYDYEEVLNQRKLYGSDWRKYFDDFGSAIYSEKAIERLNRLVVNKHRVILVLAPINRNKVLSAEKFFLKQWKDYKIEEIITLGNIRILSLSHTLK